MLPSALKKKLQRTKSKPLVNPNEDADETTKKLDENVVRLFYRNQALHYYCYNH